MSSCATGLAPQGRPTREVILDAATQLFGERGYRGCTLAQIVTSELHGADSPARDHVAFLVATVLAVPAGPAGFGRG